MLFAMQISAGTYTTQQVTVHQKKKSFLKFLPCVSNEKLMYESMYQRAWIQLLDRNGNRSDPQEIHKVFFGPSNTSTWRWTGFCSCIGLLWRWLITCHDFYNFPCALRRQTWGMCSSASVMVTATAEDTNETVMATTDEIEQDVGYDNLSETQGVASKGYQQVTTWQVDLFSGTQGPKSLQDKHMSESA